MDINAIFSKIRKIVVSNDFNAGVLYRRSYFGVTCRYIVNCDKGRGLGLVWGLGCVGALWLRPW